MGGRGRVCALIGAHARSTHSHDTDRSQRPTHGAALVQVRDLLKLDNLQGGLAVRVVELLLQRVGLGATLPLGLAVDVAENKQVDVLGGLRREGDQGREGGLVVEHIPDRPWAPPPLSRNTDGPGHARRPPRPIA